MVKFQLDNPNNARTNINFNSNGKTDVNFLYIGQQSPYMICYKWFVNKLFLVFILPCILFSGLFLDRFYLTKNIIWVFCMLVFYLGILYIIPCIFALIFISNKKLLRLMPYLQTMFKTKYVVTFHKEDIVNNKLEIPLYSNQFLHYKFLDDFANKIGRIEVKEHPFNILTTKILTTKTRLFKKSEVKLNPNEYLWKATFYFNKLPENGKLRIMFC
jgi:hypothetical protein